MGLFDFFKSNKKKPSIDLSDYKFLSDDHSRIENGKPTNIDNKGAWRGIRVKTSDSITFYVTMYNMNENHPVWGDNIQMAEKRMKLIEENNDKIVLRGFGTDTMGASFADYGLTLFKLNDNINNVTLHMHDRNIDIEYKKASNAKPYQIQNTALKQILPTPSTDIIQIMTLMEVIHNCQDLTTLNLIYNQKGNFNHPQICYDFGVAFLIKDNEINAKKALTQGAIYGLQYPCLLYDNAFIDSVGQCLSILMTQFPIADNATAIKVTALGYIYLSRCIELLPRQAQDSYRTRALLLKNHENPMIVQSLIMENIGRVALIEPYIISDFYFSSQADGSPHQSSYQRAKKIHQELDDITIGGKDADDYSLDEMAEFGEMQHLILFKILEQKYKNGEFNLTIEELKSTSR